MTAFRVSEADGGDFGNGKVAWDILHAVAASADTYDAVDLTNCKHLCPYSIACLAAMSLRAPDRLKLVLPGDLACRDHVLRIGLAEFFQVGSDIVPARRDTNVVSRQLTDRPGTFASEAMSVLAEHCNLSTGELPRLQNHLDEVILNALTHSDSAIGAVVVGQGFPSSQKVDVAVLDLGITIRGHLAKHPKYSGLSNDTLAIVKATEEGVTGTVGLNKWNEANSGAGLTELRAFAASGNCELSVLSGRGLIVFGAGDPKDKGFRNHFPGCLVNVRFFVG